MARSIRGWIRNLADGLGPPPGTVEVHAKLQETQVELNRITHTLGALTHVHQAGSGSATLADSLGHFGWDLELSPGPIAVEVTPTDPQTEYRRRFPDESAQTGKAFMSDLERLGWAGGKEGIIWGAVPGGYDPASAASWSTDPSSPASWGQGNGSIAAFGTGRFTIRPFIGFLGGVVFSVELGDLAIPVDGESAAPGNGTGTDRWDLYCAKMDNNPASNSYGKQSFELTQGGATIPPFPGNTSLVRRFPLFALKMAAGSSVYSSAYDLRRWVNPPAGVVSSGAVIRVYDDPGSTQTIVAPSVVDSAANTQAAAGEVILPLGCAWDGYMTYSANFETSTVLVPGVYLDVIFSTEGRRLAGDAALPAANYASFNTFAARMPPVAGSWVPLSVTCPLHRIPAYGSGSSLSPSSRDWTRLRAVVKLQSTQSGLDLINQRIMLHLWPVG